MNETTPTLTHITIPDVSIESCAKQADAGTRILDLIGKLQAADAERKQTLRTNYRYPVVMPVSIRTHGNHCSISGISRNLSHSGIGLITDQTINELSICVLEIQPDGLPPSEVVAECRWCKTFGSQFYMSGWEFLRISDVPALPIEDYK